MHRMNTSVTMKSNMQSFILFLTVLICGVSPDHGVSEDLINTAHIEQTYLANEVQIQSETLDRWKQWKATENWRSYCASLKDYSPDCDTFITGKDLVLRRQDDLLEKQGESELMMMISVGIGFFAGVAAAVALAQNANQESRISALESDQTNMCTAIKSFTSADSGLTFTNAGVTTGSSGNLQYLVNLAAVTAPSCS